MDSWAEADWLTRFRRFVAGNTALIITHRFTTALQADRIYFLAIENLRSFNGFSRNMKLFL